MTYLLLTKNVKTRPIFAEFLKYDQHFDQNPIPSEGMKSESPVIILIKSEQKFCKIQHLKKPPRALLNTQ